MEKEFIKKIWRNHGKGKYLRINKKDGSMPSYKEFEKIMSN